MMRLMKLLICAAAVLLLSASCTKENAVPQFGEITSVVYDTHANIRCSVTDCSDAYKYGFRYGERVESLKELNVIPVDGELNARLIGLKPGTTYLVQAFARKGDVLLTSETSTLTTTAAP